MSKEQRLSVPTFQFGLIAKYQVFLAPFFPPSLLYAFSVSSGPGNLLPGSDPHHPRNQTTTVKLSEFSFEPEEGVVLAEKDFMYQSPGDRRPWMPSVLYAERREEQALPWDSCCVIRSLFYL